MDLSTLDPHARQKLYDQLRQVHSYLWHLKARMTAKGIDGEIFSAVCRAEAEARYLKELVHFDLSKHTGLGVPKPEPPS